MLSSLKPPVEKRSSAPVIEHFYKKKFLNFPYQRAKNGTHAVYAGAAQVLRRPEGRSFRVHARRLQNPASQQVRCQQDPAQAGNGD